MKLYFTLEELNQRKHPLSEEVLANLQDLISRLSAFRAAYGSYMVVTSGFRSEEDQKRIYKDKPRVPLHSAHLVGKAADIADRDGSLAAFCYANVPLLEKCGLWLEDPTYTRGWVHFQSIAPASGSRFFRP